jgi:hypothetical protein
MAIRRVQSAIDRELKKRNVPSNAASAASQPKRTGPSRSVSASRRRHYKLPCDESLGATFLLPNVYDGASMAIQIIMDHTGDTRHWFNPDDTKALSKAEKRFKSLTSVGYTAAVRDAAGKATVTRSFDPAAEETLFFPRLVGG